MKDEKMAGLAQGLKVVAHPTRLMILAELQNGVKCVGDISGLLDARQPNVSQHLTVLRENGLGGFRREGVLRCYYLKRPALVKALFALLERHYPAVEPPLSRRKT